MSNINDFTSWKDRNCPNMRICWSFSWEAYDLRTSDRALFLRRLAMGSTLVIRTFLSILSIFRQAWGGFLASVIIGVILTILNFFFIGWCLAKIGEAEDERRVFGKLIGRFHFDVFLAFCALIHVALLLSSFMALAGFTRFGLSGTWLTMWLLIFAVAWITTWEPEGGINI